MNREKIILLFDNYNELLNKKEIVYFKEYYYEDLSLSEIAENHDVSKSYIGKVLNNIKDKLLQYESILHNHEIKKILKDNLDKLDNNSKNKILDFIE